MTHLSTANTVFIAPDSTLEHFFKVILVLKHVLQ